MGKIKERQMMMIINPSLVVTHIVMPHQTVETVGSLIVMMLKMFACTKTYGPFRQVRYMELS